MPNPQPSKSEPTAVLAVDTGGTFTDLILLRDGKLTALKVPSTPHDPAEAVLDGIQQLLGQQPGSFELLHGSTVATNALLERKGARVVLITNRGFEDVIEIGRQNRPQLYALVGTRPPPLVSAENRIGITGRISAEGDEIEPLDPKELADLPKKIRDADSVAICLLHSYADPSHERAAAAALEHAEVPISVSSGLLPEYREYERSSTTVVNAYVTTLMGRYLGRLAAEAKALRTTIMGSSGGTLSVERAMREPAKTVLSGPAGGVVAALDWGHRSGSGNVLSFDMGGTSTDVSLCPGQPLHTREFEIGGVPVALPVLDIHTVGAGGGSIARIDAAGALTVGPESAGASPGPICYGRGGTEVTVTDAHVWLGRLPATAFLGGTGSLRRDVVEEPLRRLAADLGLGLEEAAEGILTVADAAMERALRVISVERGYDPAGFAVAAFGGAGALHVAELTERLGAAQAIVPPDPGLLSAYGMLAASQTREVSRTVLLPSDSPNTSSTLSVVAKSLEAEARAGLRAEGADDALIATTLWIDARYQGQSFELRVPFDGWEEEFHDRHAARYGYARPEATVEAVTVRAIATAPGPELAPAELEIAAAPPPVEQSDVWYRGGTVRTTVVRRSDLRAGHELTGPALVVEYSATTWVPPEWTLQVDRYGVLHLEQAR